MIALCLQCCPLDQSEALSLARLISDIEPEFRGDGEFFLVYRKDCSLWLAKEFERLVAPKFARVVAREARNFDTGWPGGSNMLAASAFMEMTLLQREGLCRHDGFLLFEPDCIPLVADWINQLSDQWDLTKGQNKQACGHWHQEYDPSTLHMNGNGIFRSDWFDRHPNWLVGSGMQGWDFFYREGIISVSRDTNLIFQHYNRHGITLEELEAIEKNGEKPVFFHGIKTAEGRCLVRQKLVKSFS